jgi:hypothetical protein
MSCMGRVGWTDSGRCNTAPLRTRGPTIYDEAVEIRKHFGLEGIVDSFTKYDYECRLDSHRMVSGGC